MYMQRQAIYITARSLPQMQAQRIFLLHSGMSPDRYFILSTYCFIEPSTFCTTLNKQKLPSWHSVLLYHHSHHRDNVTVPHGRPKLRSRLHGCHAQERGPHSPEGHVVASAGKNKRAETNKRPVGLLVELQQFN